MAVPLMLAAAGSPAKDLQKTRDSGCGASLLRMVIDEVRVAGGSSEGPHFSFLKSMFPTGVRGADPTDVMAQLRSGFGTTNKHLILWIEEMLTAKVQGRYPNPENVFWESPVLKNFFRLSEQTRFRLLVENSSRLIAEDYRYLIESLVDLDSLDEAGRIWSLNKNVKLTPSAANRLLAFYREKLERDLQKRAMQIGLSLSDEGFEFLAEYGETSDIEKLEYYRLLFGPSSGQVLAEKAIAKIRSRSGR